MSTGLKPEHLEIGSPTAIQPIASGPGLEWGGQSIWRNLEGRALAWIGPLLVIGLFCVPLFVGLDLTDLDNDESIYSYAVDRILETGEWLTPRSLPSDRAFLEKPPLKFWIVAAGIRSGLLPHNELGYRFFDALFGSIAFLYVYALATLLVGGGHSDGRQVWRVFGGLASVLVLFAIHPLIFTHGLRSNNMEAPLVLAYCAGIYHFARWHDAASPRQRLRHALAVSAWFALAFMVKFVAALFLPLLCLLAALWQAGAVRRLRETMTDWLWGGLLVLAVTAPWFAYQTAIEGGRFWHIILGRHVVDRFTSALDPAHLNPWHFYFSETWKEVVLAGMGPGIGLGLLWLAFRAWQGRPWLARLILLWGLVPYMLMSGGTSKLFHYAYPFLPPLALGLGWLVASGGRVLAGGLERALAHPFTSRAVSLGTSLLPASVSLKRVLAAVGVVALLVAAATMLFGRLEVSIGDRQVFRNNSVMRPFVAGALLLALGGSFSTALNALAMLAVAAGLPVAAHADRLAELRTVRDPLRALGSCVAAVQASDERAGRGVYNAAKGVTYQPYNYYLGRLGPYPTVQHPERRELRRRLFRQGRQTPIVVSRSEFSRALDMVTPEGTSLGTVLAAVAVDDRLVVLLPGPYQACARPALMAGAQPAALPSAGDNP